LAGGAVIGIVTNNTDPEGLSRVKVKFPSISDLDESFWARVAVPMAGNDRGVRFPLAIDDEVLVIFGHLREPFVVGALWNGKDKPPTEDNNLSVMKSRGGHVITLNDADGAQTVEIVDASGKNSIVVDTAANTITIRADKDITLAAPNGTITLSAQTVEIAASEKAEVSSGQDGLKVHSSGDVFVSGKTVNLN
jgi:uncharacterized protein involved in type VI secretion and phage assembly